MRKVLVTAGASGIGKHIASAFLAAGGSVYTFMTLPMAAVTPAITSKLKNPLPFGILLSCVAAIGYFGILFAPPSTAIVWAFIAGWAAARFPSP